MLHKQLDSQVGIEYLVRFKIGFLIMWKIGTNP